MSARSNDIHYQAKRLSKKIRSRIARRIYPDGFWNEDASNEIDRLTDLVERYREKYGEVG